MNYEEQLINTIFIDLFLELDDVADIEYPPELNAFIIVMKNGKRYRVLITEEFPELPF